MKPLVQRRPDTSILNIISMISIKTAATPTLCWRTVLTEWQLKLTMRHRTIKALLPLTKLVPLAEPEHHGGEFAHRSAIYPPQGAGEQGAAVCPGV